MEKLNKCYFHKRMPPKTIYTLAENARRKNALGQSKLQLHVQVASPSYKADGITNNVHVNVHEIQSCRAKESGSLSDR